jgi:hypothetical protein
MRRVSIFYNCSQSIYLNYLSAANFKTSARPFLGDGIFNSDGDIWYRQRKTSANIFTTKNFRGAISLVMAFPFILFLLSAFCSIRIVNHENLARLVDYLSLNSDLDKEIDLQQAFHCFTLDRYYSLVMILLYSASNAFLI